MMLSFASAKAGQPAPPPPPTATISCSGGGTGCFLVDPETSASYLVNISNEPSGYTRTISWTTSPSGATTLPLGANTTNFSVLWKNQTNTPARTLTVTVTYSKAGSSNITATATRTVVVKYLAPITALTATGGGVTPGSVANGGTLTIPCGARTFTLTAVQAAPVTNPTIGVTYTWSFPWGSTVTTSTPTVTTTSNIGLTDGTISVVARRADGVTFSQSLGVNVSRPRVTNSIITSLNWSPEDKPLCLNQQRQLSGSSSPNATLFTWTASGGTSIVSGANSAIATVQGTSNGQVTLTVSNACGVSLSKQKTIPAGTPQLTSITVDQHPNYYPNYINGNTYIHIESGSACETYKWELFGGSGYFYPNPANCGNVFNGINFNESNNCYASTSTNMALKVRSANVCGQGQDAFIPLQNIGAKGFYSMASPNPANSTVAVVIDKDLADNEMPGIRLISHLKSNVVKSFDPAMETDRSDVQRSENLVSFDVSDLPRGMYYLVLTFGGKKNFKEIIVLE